MLYSVSADDEVSPASAGRRDDDVTAGDVTGLAADVSLAATPQTGSAAGAPARTAS